VKYVRIAYPLKFIPEISRSGRSTKVSSSESFFFYSS